MFGRPVKGQLSGGLESVMAGQSMKWEIQARMWVILNTSRSLSQGNLDSMLYMVNRESLNFDGNYKL